MPRTNESNTPEQPMNIKFLSKLYFAAFLAATTIAPTISAADSIELTETISSTLTHSDIQMAEAWELSHREYEQLKQLKIQYQGLVSTNLTPIEWLGIFASDDETRKQYAKRLAKLQFETTTAILKFETAYTAAMQALSSKSPGPESTHHRLLLVASMRCHDAQCSRHLTEGLEHVSRGGLLDIYFQHPFDNAQLKTWASTNDISAAQLDNESISITQAKGHMLNVSPGLYRVN